MGQSAEMLCDGDDKENTWKKETEVNRETADYLLPRDTRSTIQPSIGHGRTSRHIHHYLCNPKVTNLQSQTGFKHKTKANTTKEKVPTHEGRTQQEERQEEQHHGRPQETSVPTTEDGTGTHEAPNQTEYHRIPHNNNCHKIILNTGNRNTTVREQGIRTPQQEQCTHKQVNRDEKEDSRSMDNERNETGRTPQTSINNQQKQSKAREELDRTINLYKELNTRTDSRPKQHKHYIHKGKVNDRHSHHNHDHCHRKRSSKQHCHDNIRDIHQGTATQQGGHGQQDQSSNNNRTAKHRATGVRNTRKTRNKDDETQQKRKRS
jgi:hypothetical protein